MKIPASTARRAVLLTAVCSLIAACATPQPLSPDASLPAGFKISDYAESLRLLNRVTWGVNSTIAREASAAGLRPYLEQQLKPRPAALPPPVQRQIDALGISQRPAQQIVMELEQKRKDFSDVSDPALRREAQKAYQQVLSSVARETAARSMLRAIYSPNQLQEQMTWFWMNHFNVFQGKNNVRAMIGDYEEQAIRPQALGKFRDLLRATVFHPVIPAYLDDENDAADKPNENTARELLELHTLGMDGGYAQADIQQLARILTRRGNSLNASGPGIRKDLQDQSLRRDPLELKPNRLALGDNVGDNHHDSRFLGKNIGVSGLSEVDEAIDLMSRHPSTARFVSRKLALFFVSDQPSTDLIDALASKFVSTDGDIAKTLGALFASEEFARSLGGKFKDPVHYAVSAVRLVYDGQVIQNVAPVLNWIAHMGQPLYGKHPTEGYLMTKSAWAGAGQLTTRFDIAKAISANGASLFRPEASAMQQAIPLPVRPQLPGPENYESLQGVLSDRTLEALSRARSPLDWHILLLSSPEMMHR